MAKVPADEMRRHVGSLLGKAVEALGEVREVVVRTSQVGKIKLDTTFLRRERERLFARLGEEVYDRLEEGEIAGFEELAGLLDQLRETGRRLEEHEEELAAVEADGVARRVAREEGRRQAEAVAESIREGKWDEEPLSQKAVDSGGRDVVKEAPPLAGEPAPKKKRGGRKVAAAPGGSTPEADDEER